MAEAEVAFETKAIRVVRGMESRTAMKWKSDGWELVSQAPGRLRTELTFRRPKPKSRWQLWAIGAAALAIALTLVIVFGTIAERNASLTTMPPEPSATPSESSPVAASTAEPSSEPEEVTLTAENNAELAALLALTDYCDPSVAAFADNYQGHTIAFSGSVGAIASHDGASTRYDILIGAGDFSKTSAPGPAFQFRDVNTTGDLHFVGTVPDSISVGTRLNITAEVLGYETNSCLFLLDPISTAGR